MAMNVYSLGSGSKGNCIIISDGQSSIMIDAGLGIKATCKNMKDAGFFINDIKGILLTHEHNDHIRSVAEMSEYLKVYSNPETLSAVNATFGGNINTDNLCPIEEKPFCIGNFEITPFNVSHDAVHPYGYVINNGHEKVGYLTDTGYISKGVFKHIMNSDIIVLESNHDKELLMRGAYPERLKRRIFSDKGHLCNDETALVVCDLVKNKTKKVLLAHISENNNLTELAYWTTVKRLEETGISSGINGDVEVKVALQRETVII